MLKSQIGVLLGTSQRATSYTSSPPTSFVIVAFSVTVFVAIFVTILLLNGGIFTYTLDDAYIHLELAREIWQGHYGINHSEFAAPSSSVLWPFILAPFSPTFFAAFVPLLINIASTLGSVLVAYKIFSQVDIAKPWKLFSVFAFALSINLFGLAFSGMEHSLQVFLSLALLYAVIQTAETGDPPRMIWFLIVLGPLIRYENLILSGPVLLWLFFRKRYVHSLATGFLLAACLIGFSLLLSSLGLGFFPTSVLAKLGGLHLVYNVVDTTGGKILVLLLLLLVFRCIKPRNSSDGFLAIVMIIPAATYLMVGTIDHRRYEIFLLAVLNLILVYFYGAALTEWVTVRRKWLILLLPVYFIIYHAYFLFFLATAYASHNIYEQQYQMGIFVKEIYQRPVAINDLGLVSYRNDHYVLDLIGLASIDALRYRKTENNSDWMNDLAQQYDVELAMIYTSWFPNPPENWEPIAELYLNPPRLTAADRVVTFYVIEPSAREIVLTRLDEFSNKIPTDIRLTVVAP